MGLMRLREKIDTNENFFVNCCFDRGQGGSLSSVCHCVAKSCRVMMSVWLLFLMKYSFHSFWGFG